LKTGLFLTFCLKSHKILNSFSYFLCLPRRYDITISQGDPIHHPQHGIGTVQSIRERSFSGPGGDKFAKLFFPRENLIMMIREDELPQVIRKPIKPAEAKKVLAHISDWKGSSSDSWKVRANAMQKKLDKGDPFGLAEVYKTLVLRQRADTLSGADRRQLIQSERCLSEELAAALRQPVPQVCTHMENAAIN
jgi:RNA polymerase-interacting CarD/CdnL/TRCF family regulator